MRYKLVVNHKWLTSSDNWEQINDTANRIWLEAIEEESGNCIVIKIYDSETGEWC